MNETTEATNTEGCDVRCSRCGWAWDGVPSKWRTGSATPADVCDTCWYSEVVDVRESKP